MYDVKAHSVFPFNQDEFTQICVASEKIYNIPSEECYLDETIKNLAIIARFCKA